MLKILLKLRDHWASIVAKCNEMGIPLPLVRDPKTKRGDVALTLVFLSSIWVQVGLVGKWSHKLDGIDITQALNWFYACAGLYWARKLNSDGQGKVEIGQKIDQNPSEKQE